MSQTIEVTEIFDQTEEGPELEHQIVVFVDKDLNIKQIATNAPF